MNDGLSMIFIDNIFRKSSHIILILMTWQFELIKDVKIIEGD